MLSFDLTLIHSLMAAILSTRIFFFQTPYRTASLTPHRAIICHLDSVSQSSSSRLAARLLPSGINHRRFDHLISPRQVVLELRKSWKSTCLYLRGRGQMLITCGGSFSN